MSVQYLVDFENVHEAGLYGMESLAEDDCVYIFHTSAGDRISLSRLDGVQARVRVIFVPAGKQSLDMHLGSYLGYLIGKENAEKRYAIISHDTDYINIADFWNKTCQSSDKVRCIHGIKYSDGITSPDVWASIPADYSPQRAAIREFILRVYSKYAVNSLCSAPCMLVSELCARLNSLPEYIQERNRTGKKPMQYLLEECRDILWIRRQWSQEWAFLLAAQVGDSMPDTAESVSAEAVPAETVLSGEPDGEEALPDIMEMGDLSIDDEPLMAEEQEEGAAAVDDAKLVYSVPADEAVPAAEEEPEETDLLAAALDYMRDAEESVRNADGCVRASALRDRLMTLPKFRSALKESGMKPILFIQLLFSGNIQVFRIKGVYWASLVQDEKGEGDDARDAAMEERKKNFYEMAFSNIRKQLTDAGMDGKVADEIAGICMRSGSETEPRKQIHMLLCQRFGNKIGVKYYRKAVKYICA